ncbi:MAG: hypothetical protein ACTS1X_09620 [Parasphingopyxis sp.]
MFVRLDHSVERHSYASTNMVRRAADSPVGWQALASHVSGVVCRVGEGE